MRKIGFWFFTSVIGILVVLIVLSPVICAILNCCGIHVDAQLMSENSKYCLEKIIPVATGDYLVMGGIGMIEAKNKDNVIVNNNNG